MTSEKRIEHARDISREYRQLIKQKSTPPAVSLTPPQLAALRVALEALELCARGDIWAMALRLRSGCTRAERGRFGAAAEVVRGIVENMETEQDDTTR